MLRQRNRLILVAALTVLMPTASAFAQVYKVAELSSASINALDRATTVVILPGGILEQHAGHLPAFADGYMNQVIADSLAAAVSRKPGFRSLIFPMIPLGTGGANEIAGKYSWPGTYAVRAETLRAIFMDLATELGEQGFKWIFIVHNHGSPWHNKALDEAGDFFRDTYGGRMVNLTGLEPDWSTVAAARKHLVTPQMEAEDANSVHAGLSETSRVMYVRGDLVSAETVRATPSVTTPLPRLAETAQQANWPGYFGAPRYANAAIGKADHEASAKAWISIALRILSGEEDRTMQRYADTMLSIPMIQVMGKGRQHYEGTVAKKQSDWLARRKQVMTDAARMLRGSAVPH